MSQEGNESLKHAKYVILAVPIVPRNHITPLTNETEIERALDILASASADTESKRSLQDESFFEKLLDVLIKGYPSDQPPPRPSRNLLRCIGNLLADNDVNRLAFNNYYDSIRVLAAPLLDYHTGKENTDLEDLVVKVYFNLCNDSPEMQRRAFENNIDDGLIFYMSARKWEAKDEALFSLSTSLLASLYEASTKEMGERRLRYDLAFVRRVLGLPSLAMDTETSLDLLSVVCVLLQDEEFLRKTVQHHHLHLVWSSLELVDETLRGELDEDDQKQYRQYLNVIAQSIADMSSTPAFNVEYTLQDDFIQQLCDKCIPSEGRPTSIIPGCACLTLGNIAVDDATTIKLASKLTSIEHLLEHLGKSDESVFLNAAAGLLRHLATPMSNRQKFFNDPLCLKQVAHLYTDVTLEQIQVAGLQLTRQIVTGMPGQTHHLIARTDGHIPDLNTFLTLFKQTTSTATKLEIARLITALLRTLQAPDDKSSCETSLSSLVMTPDVLTPIMLAIKQSPGPGTTQAQADAWLALNLFARIPGGANVLATSTSEDGEFISVLRRRLGGTDEGAVIVGGAAAESNGDEAPAEDTRPAWVRDKERDNAVVLVHDVLKSEDVSEQVKDRLRALLGESEIVVR